MTAGTMPSQKRGQVRVFVIVWTFLTLLMGLATFMAIYFATNPGQTGGIGVNSALPADGEVVVALASVTPLPATATISPSATPTTLPTEVPSDANADTNSATNADNSSEGGVVVAQAAQPTATSLPTETAIPTITPTPLPVDVDYFEAGIQVQYSLDFNLDNQNGYYNSVYNDLGLDWVKTQVRWEDVERERDQYDWGKLDLTMTSSAQFGIKQLLSIVTAPAWSREAGVNLDAHGPPANNQDYVDFVLKIIDRYPGQVHAIEVWNEQNLDREWTSINGLSAINYVGLLRDTYNAVKAVDPGIIIVSGALSPTGFDDGIGAINDFRYMDLMIQAGMLDVTDCIGAHHNGYNIGPSVRWDNVPNDPSAQFRGPFDNPHHSWSFRSTLEGYNSRVRAAGYDTPLCVTEFGWAVTEDLEGAPPGFEFANDNTLEEQSTWIPEAMGLMQEWGFVRLAIVWNFNYAPQAGWDPNNDNVPYSLIGPNWNFRPAYDAIRTWQSEYEASLINNPS
jgi:hypothetical protein